MVAFEPGVRGVPTLFVAEKWVGSNVNNYYLNRFRGLNYYYYYSERTSIIIQNNTKLFFSFSHFSVVSKNNTHHCLLCAQRVKIYFIYIIQYIYMDGVILWKRTIIIYILYYYYIVNAGGSVDFVLLRDNNYLKFLDFIILCFFVYRCSTSTNAHYCVVGT